MSRKYYGIPAGYEDELIEEYEMDMLGPISRTAQNLKITIVPDINTGAGINGQDFDCSMNSEMDIWFDNFRLMWNSYKKTPSAQQMLKTVLMKDPQPTLLALKFFANCPECNNLKNKNLAFFVLDTVCELHDQHPNIANSCDDNTRMVAFNFIKTCGIVSLYKSVFRTYSLHKIRDLLAPKVKEMIARQEYKDAAYWAMLLKITHLFGLYEIILPLILQDKVFLAEEYLSAEKGLQLSTVQFLDTLLDKRKSVLEHCEPIIAEHHYEDIRHNVLSFRPISKLVTRLAKKYTIDSRWTPNLNFSKACSYMHYLHHKYQDGGMSLESWRELIRDAANTKALKIDLVDNVATYGDMHEAIYWAKYFKLSPNECPSYMRGKLEESYKSSLAGASKVVAAVSDGNGANPSRNGIISHKNPIKTYPDYLELNLPEECIILVDKQKKFLRMISYLERQTLIAFDSEWKPSVCSDNAVSLLQLATSERVYLLDCLETTLGYDLWQLLGRKVFNNVEILKLGFSLKQDLNMLCKSLPALNIDLQDSSGYLDLRDLWRRLKYMQVININFGYTAHSGESLCALCEVCFGKKLDKSNQCSNWANRPLRQDQIIYAALDAHCLLQIYQVLADLLAGKGIDINQVIDEVTMPKGVNSRHTKRSSARPVAAQTTKPNEELTHGAVGGGDDTVQRRCKEIKFICDVMLLSLSKQLRKLGIDCIDITKYDIKEFIDIIKNEGRYLLTRDSRYIMFCKELPPTQCIQIPADSTVEQVLNVVKLFKISVQERDIFTRCTICNCDEFILVHNDEFELLLYGQSVTSGTKVRSEHCNINPFEKTFKILKCTTEILRTKRTHRGTVIKLNRVSYYMIRTKEYVYICDNCGTCTWDGDQTIPSSISKYIFKTQQCGK